MMDMTLQTLIPSIEVQVAFHVAELFANRDF